MLRFKLSVSRPLIELADLFEGDIKLTTDWEGKNAIISDLFSTFPWENSSVSASGGTGRRLLATGFFSDVRAFVVVCILALAIARCCCCCCLIRMSTAQFQNM